MRVNSIKKKKKKYDYINVTSGTTLRMYERLELLKGAHFSPPSETLTKAKADNIQGVSF